jgi:arabinogalactan oligomer / maltooligosaccharide transport system substrate-binding protein
MIGQASLMTVFKAVTRPLVWLAMLAGLLAVAACGDAGKAKDSLIIWHGYRGEEKAALEEAIKVWNDRAGPGQLPVKAVAVPAEAIPNKLTASVPRGKGPDLFLFAHDRMGGWVEAGETLDPLDFWLTPEITDDYLPGLLDAVTYKGAVYALPLNFKSIALIYNKALVETPPTTTAELLTMAKAQTNAPQGRFGLVYAYDVPFFHGALLNGTGASIFNADREPVLGSEASIAAAELLLKWRGEVLPSDPTPSLMDTLFNDGRAAFILNGPWFIGQISKDIDYGVAVLPGISERPGTPPMRPWMSVEAVYLAANKPDARQAFEFARFLTGSEGAAIMAKGGQLPANAAIYETPALRDNAVVQAFKDQAINGVATPNFPEMTLVWTPLEKALRRIVKRQATPAEALAELQREVSAAVAALKASSGEGS